MGKSCNFFNVKKLHSSTFHFTTSLNIAVLMYFPNYILLMRRRRGRPRRRQLLLTPPPAPVLLTGRRTRSLLHVSRCKRSYNRFQTWGKNVYLYHTPRPDYSSWGLLCGPEEYSPGGKFKLEFESTGTVVLAPRLSVSNRRYYFPTPSWLSPMPWPSPPGPSSPSGSSSPPWPSSL